jgi:hypothetical protein
MPLTDEKMIELCENVATVLANTNSLASILETHTDADNKNFEEMKLMNNKVQTQLDTLTKEKVDSIIVQLAEQRGAAKNRAIVWSMITSGALFTVLEFLRGIFIK